MLVKVLLRHNRKSPIQPGYRPDWVSERKPDYNCGRVWLAESLAPPDEAVRVLIEPLDSSAWDVQVGDKLFAKEGKETVASAEVLWVYR